MSVPVPISFPLWGWLLKGLAFVLALAVGRQCSSTATPLGTNLCATLSSVGLNLPTYKMG